MFLVSGPDMVVASCRAGVIGSFPNQNARTIADYERFVHDVATSLEESGEAVAPWAANLITHSTNARLPQELELLRHYKPPLVITALGSPRPVLDVVHGYGGLVIADVSDLGYARKAIDAGVDGLACVCAGAGGHTGKLSPFAFVAAIRETFDGLVIVGGGISTGAGIAGALAAGADLVYMGTRFIPSVESLAVDAYKQMVVDCSADDLLVSAGITGAAASWLVPSLRANGLDPARMPESPSIDASRAHGEARRWKTIWSAGQGVTTIHAVEPIAAIVDRLEAEFHRACDRLGASREGLRRP